MRKVVSLLLIIFTLSLLFFHLSAYAGEGASPDDIPATIKWAVVPVVGALCGAIGILYNELIKVMRELTNVLKQHSKTNAEIAKQMAEAINGFRVELAALTNNVEDLSSKIKGG